MAEIFYTDSKFKAENVPFLVNNNMELLVIPNRWLNYISLIRGRTRSPKTWKAYGNQLLYFLDWLEINELDWSTAKERELSDYRIYLERTLTTRGRLPRRNTIHAYMSNVVRFYKWAYREKYISELPFNIEIIQGQQSGGFFKHLDGTGGLMEVTDIIPSREKTEVPYISRSQQEKLIEEVLDKEEDELLYAFMLLTGMRVEEITNMKVYDLPEDDISRRTRVYKFNIVGKGKKERAVYIEHHFLVKLLNWRDFKRPLLAKKWKKKTGRLSDSFWLNSRGGPLSKKTLWNWVRKWGEKAGFHLTPHMFRHTFAFLHYAKTKDIRVLQKLLGHSQLSSTEIYTHLDPEQILKTVAQLDEEIAAMYKKGK